MTSNLQYTKQTFLDRILNESHAKVPQANTQQILQDINVSNRDTELMKAERGWFRRHFPISELSIHFIYFCDEASEVFWRIFFSFFLTKRFRFARFFVEYKLTWFVYVNYSVSWLYIVSFRVRANCNTIFIYGVQLFGLAY